MEILQRGAVYLPVLLALIVMIPRLLSPHFGLFDDGRSLITAQEIRNGDWSFHFDAGEGRFRPMYWLTFSITYWIFGSNPFWFFLANTLVLVISTYCIVQSLINIGTTHFQAWVTGTLFVVASPIIENYYTLSKGEPWEIMFLMISFLVISGYHKQRNRAAIVMKMVLVGLFQLMAILSKETAIIIAPLAGVWLLGKYLTVRYQPNKAALVPFVVYFSTACVSFATYLFMRFALVSSAFTTKGYTSLYEFTTSQILAASIRWTGWLIRDFLYVVPLLLVVGIFWFGGRKFPQHVLIFNTMIWIITWIVVYLPWYFMTEYYMLPVALGMAFLAGALLTILLPAVRENNFWKRLTSGGVILLFLILLIPTLLNDFTSARIQISQDKTNTNLLSYLASKAPVGSIILVNFRVPSEYIDQMNFQFQSYYNRPDLVVKLFDPTENDPVEKYYLLAPHVIHRPLMTVRMGVDEPSQITWNKELDAYLATHPKWKPVVEFDEQFQLALFDLPRVLCPVIKTRSFCATPSPLVDFRQFSYGWTVYELK
jgi:hypothetical protein